jgi:predicted transcriptional regulator YdeE
MGDKTQQPDLLEPELVTCEAHHLTGLAFFADPGTPSFHSFWASFMAVKARVTGQTGTFRQFTSWCEDPELDGMAVLCAVETDPGSPQEPLFTCRTVPAARHLRFRHVGDIGGIAQTYAFIYGTWFARHDILPLPGWEFQSYSQNGAITEIHIPIELL